MLKKIVGKFRKPHIVILSNEEKVKELSEKAMGLFDHMKKAHDELHTINLELDMIVRSEQRKIDEENERHQREIKNRTENIVHATNEINMNNKVKEKLADFIR
ncbi:hypothetical protein M5X00_26275 [Paenibacillus alvei]|uniref:hypothetical protein n=1 Tax=Paenibacillus alvei TaxID=44250 RepID=UPI000288E7A6|nr:hypothetical protein [Paenibacillus alvei]EJW14092.1 hypothetical protein PAV_141p01980 [Paenibacillus alvei DSM 29]MCY9545038.1 hypothetical protein [Paenibacillus alvei]MCY9707758.1 hypothetical protein [Paenibacillus alvei]MCY9757739.1 hypothetical protein [Paenibacillus alvei]MEC0082729.1 hypothetical protein [Paenibacillus alvei]